MVDVIRNFQYKTAGRGRGVLGLKDLRPCRRPGEKAASGGGAASKEASSAGKMAGSSKPSTSNGETYGCTSSSVTQALSYCQVE